MGRYESMLLEELPHLSLRDPALPRLLGGRLTTAPPLVELAAVGGDDHGSVRREESAKVGNESVSLRFVHVLDHLGGDHHVVGPGFSRHQVCRSPHLEPQGRELPSGELDDSGYRLYADALAIGIGQVCEPAPPTADVEDSKPFRPPARQLAQTRQDARDTDRLLQVRMTRRPDGSR